MASPRPEPPKPAAAYIRVLPEQVRKLLWVHPAALVRDRDRDVQAVADRRDPDGEGLRRVPGGVGKEVVQDLHDALPVAQHARQALREVDHDRVRVAAAQERHPGLVHHRRQLRRLGRDGQRARVDVPGIQQVADQAPHVIGLLVDDPEELLQFGPGQRRRGPQHRSRSSP